MLNGIDISHHNFYMQNLHELNILDFVILKATEGVRFRDPKMSTYMNVLKEDMLYGFYHFGRPDLGNDPENEAVHFINTVNPYLSNRSILALDIEAEALKVKELDKWCATFMQIVDITTGILPMLYISISETKKFPVTASLGSGLWAAKWSKNKPTAKQLEPWKFWAMWQYTSEGIFSGRRVDYDIFNGSREQFMKYARCE